MDKIYYISVLLIAGLVFSKILGKFKFPDVTGFLIGGIIIGPSVLGLIPKEALSSLDVVSEVALAFIAFSIGDEMKISAIKKLGSGILLIVLLEGIFAFIAVTISTLFIFKESFAFSLTLGSIACATAPAATLMVIKQYNAKGDLVDVLIPVVALDDVLCIICFGIASSITISLISHSALSIGVMIYKPIKEIILALLLGLVSGTGFSFIIKKAKSDSETTIISVASIFMVTSIALYLKLSSLLTLMLMGVVSSNIGKSNRRYSALISSIAPPVTVCFFVLSGAELDFANLKTVGLMGASYIITRVIGKMLGAYSASKIAKFPKSVQKYLGLTLVPQAGVAIGLSLIASRIIPNPHGAMIRSIVLSATIVYELIGPLLAKIALDKAGCIKENS
ncbi:cation:proton antiporter [Peptoniphilus sp. oral taxon 386]|uniref:cation:proton antiporter n=1 Tax=Peptoniphilus sp. oral taxon 386 TaxID=652713 RepID=UPI0001DA9BA6|nr:cation:proton antiporter [Peptoniphilus sp. oral taxon 386]EFI42169.1 transporter, CPA2 family [Peptoniphilus sp. oral taxon 386 str. F0131]